MSALNGNFRKAGRSGAGRGAQGAHKGAQNGKQTAIVSVRSVNGCRLTRANRRGAHSGFGAVPGIGEPGCAIIELRRRTGQTKVAVGWLRLVRVAGYLGRLGLNVVWLARACYWFLVLGGLTSGKRSIAAAYRQTEGGTVGAGDVARRSRTAAL